MKPPPPMPQENGSVTPSTAAAVTAASVALPPRRSVSIAAFVARRSTVAAAPRYPVEVGGAEACAVEATASPAMTAVRTAIGERMRGVFPAGGWFTPAGRRHPRTAGRDRL